MVFYLDYFSSGLLPERQIEESFFVCVLFSALRPENWIMGHQEVRRLQASSNENGPGLTNEMQAKCQHVAAELRFMGDTLETSYSQGTTFSSRGKIVIGFTLLGMIVTNIAVRYFVRVLASNS